MGPTGPRWAPCWPHDLCYLGTDGVCLCYTTYVSLSLVIAVKHEIVFDNGNQYWSNYMTSCFAPDRCCLIFQSTEDAYFVVAMKALSSDAEVPQITSPVKKVASNGAVLVVVFGCLGCDMKFAMKVSIEFVCLNCLPRCMINIIHTLQDMCLLIHPEIKVTCLNSFEYQSVPTYVTNFAFHWFLWFMNTLRSYVSCYKIHSNVPSSTG